MNTIRTFKSSTAMAGLGLNSIQTRRTIAYATVFAAAGVTLTLLNMDNKLKLDSASTTTKTLSFPRTMIFSKQLRVVSSELVNHDTKLITFALPGGENEISGLPAGGAILTQHTPSNAWFPVFRPYTPVHDLDTPGILQLLVKKYPNGRASGHMHSLAPGDELTVRGPIPTYYKWKTSTKPRDVVFIAGGAGVTPIYSLARGVLNEDKNARIHLLWGVNSSNDVLLKKEIGQLKKLAGDSLNITYYVSGPKGLAEIEEAKSSTPVPAEFKPGRITEKALSEVLSAVGGIDKLGDEQGTKVFMCGPPAMEEALAGKNGILQQLGMTKKQIHQF